MFIVYDKNMNIKEFPKGVRPLDIFIPSIEKRENNEVIEGRSGVVSKGQTFGIRPPIEVSVGLEAYDTRDYRLLRDEVFSFFSNEVFYISESYQKGKQYKVTVIESYIPNRLNQRIAHIQFLLSLVDLPFAESIGTTQDIQERGINANDALWGFGMGLIADDDSLIYTHAGTSFKIYNAGNVPVHPFDQDIKITIDNIQGSTSHLELRNITTGDIFRVNEGASGTIILDGPNITRNNLNYLRQTNKQYITLAPGWNEFSVNGADSARVAFDFRFYYQ